jgi:uncharacterized repeat protein (TIGR01451 family)
MAGALLGAPLVLHAQQIIRNTAFATYLTQFGVDSVSVSNGTQTTVVRPQFTMQVTLLSAATAHSGDTVQYRVSYTNTNAIAALTNLALVDTLPTGLNFALAQPATIPSGRVVQWNLPDLGPNASAQVLLTLVVSGDVRDTVRAKNSATLTPGNAASQVGTAAEVALTGSVNASIALTQTADVLEVGLGEIAPFTLVAKNTGGVALTNVLVHATLPAGMSYSKGSATGVDSVSAQGSVLTLHLTGSLAAGATRSVHYNAALVSASSTALQDVAYAIDGPTQARSANAITFLQVRQSMPMEDRAVIGKVWVDANNNGVQDAGEIGLIGLEIWTDDGEIATTDSAGRFSYHNIRPGHHGFRLDPASVPPGYRIADGGMVTANASGWTTPQVDFRLVPTSGRISAVRVPLAWTFAMHAITASIAIAAPNRAGAPGPSVARTVDDRVGYEVAIHNPYAASLATLSLRFSEPLDSIEVLVGDSLLVRTAGSALKLPVIAPHSQLVVRSWGAWSGDSTSVVLLRDGKALDQARADVTASREPVLRVLDRALATDSLPLAADVPASGKVEITLVPPAAGWLREASFALPTGWDVVPDTSAGVPPLTTARDRNGSQVLVWHLASPRRAPIVLMLRPTGAKVVEPVRVAVQRSEQARATEKGREFLDGPGVQIFSPVDGAVLGTDRVYVGVRGERSTAVELFDGDSLIKKATTRIDGTYDFIALPLATGSHRLRVRMQNSSLRERWDSISVHISERPAAFALEPSKISLVADGATVQTVRVRVLDVSGVPVVNHPLITVVASGVEPVNPDADPSSVGLQVSPDDAGWLNLQLRPGRLVTRGKLTLAIDKVRVEYPVDVLPAPQPLLLTAVGQVGLGASPDAFGSVTLRGRIDPRTSVVASFDSRSLDAGVNAFGRTFDPLDQSQYPLLGDASTQRTYSASRYQLAARVERGYDWLAVGDISTTGFGQDLRLSGYRRALPGVAARITMGGLTWQAFGSSTSQSLRQQQLRGAGISGPYQLTSNIQIGTEQVVLEIRDATNAASVISRQVMARYVDYQIDYQTGELMLKQPVPATDVYGNPVFITVLAETENGGPASALWGLRATFDARALMKTVAMDSLRLGGTWVHESPGAGDHQLLGADLHVTRVGHLALSAETSWSQSADSSGFAATASGALTLFRGAGRLAATWMSVGSGFANPSNVALIGGTEQLKLSAEFKSGTRLVKLSHEWEHFDLMGVDREFTSATVTQAVNSKLQIEASAVNSQLTGGATSTVSQDGELKIHWKPQPQWTLTAEGRHQFALDGTNLQPDYVGADAAYAVTHDLSLDLRERMVFLPGDSAGYSVTDVGIKSRLGFGTDAFASYQIAGVSGAANAALIGLHNSLHLGTAWALNALFERRSGIDHASNLDPVRALPFVQAEENYWSFGVGAEYLQPKSPYRLTARAEYRDGSIRSTRLLTLAGDVSLNRSLAILSRNEVVRTAQVASGLTTDTHRYSTLWGLAFRPIHSDALNLLAKFESLDAANPNGGVLASSGAEGRTIFAGEAIWQPGRGTEFSMRFASRSTVGTVTSADTTSQQLHSSADFVGGRVGIRIHPLFELRADARLLAEQTSATQRADLAPQLVFLPQKTMEVVMGYRIGDLRDPDFAVNGGSGWFVTFGMHLTEATVASAADFWRQRLAGRSQ